MNTPSFSSELIFPAEHWHNHSSSIVEYPKGELLVCWYNGSGERRSDDVKVLGARRKVSGGTWSSPFVLAETPGFPDTNPVLGVDGSGRLWLFWGTQLDNQWEHTLLQYKVSHDPRLRRWDDSGVIFLKPDDERFVAEVKEKLPQALALVLPVATPEKRAELQTYRELLLKKAEDKLARRIGWMGRCKPLVLGKRMLLPLYSDGYDFSLLAMTDDLGATWSCSLPMIGPGAVQPSLALRKDGTIVAFFRNNGPAPARMLVSESKDGGKSWSLARHNNLLNPGSSVDVLTLADGRWVLAYNNSEENRHRLAISLSEDEGRTWRWTRHVDEEPGAEAADKSYPSLLQSSDGAIHLTYSYSRRAADLPKDKDGLPARESIRHARFNPEWIQAG